MESTERPSQQIEPLHLLSSPIGQEVSVRIKEDVRLPKYTEALEISENITRQAKEIGKLMAPISEDLPQILQDPSLREQMGIDQNNFESSIKPFAKSVHNLDIFGVDSIIDSNGSIKIIEINSRPQFLGRFDYLNSTIVGKNPNSEIYPHVTDILDSYRHGGIAIVISHPSNAFHNHHQLLAQQLNSPISTLQELETDKEGNIIYKDNRVDVILRQFSMRALLNPDIAKPEIVDAVKEGRVTLVNGPVAGYFGEKVALPILATDETGLSKYLPRMVVVTTGEGINLNEYKGWWLKTSTRGETELTLRLTKQNIQGWPGEVVRCMVGENFEKANGILQGKDNPTAARFLQHIKDIQNYKPQKWILQEHIEPWQIPVSITEAGKEELNTTLRIYYVKNPQDKTQPFTFTELLASKYGRVSGAGLTIPLKTSP